MMDIWKDKFYNIFLIRDDIIMKSIKFGITTLAHLLTGNLKPYENLSLGLKINTLRNLTINSII